MTKKIAEFSFAVVLILAALALVAFPNLLRAQVVEIGETNVQPIAEMKKLFESFGGADDQNAFLERGRRRRSGSPTAASARLRRSRGRLANRHARKYDRDYCSRSKMLHIASYAGLSFTHV